MEQRFHKQSEFNKFDWSLLKPSDPPFKTNGENYSFAKGGNYYVHGDGWFIDIHNEDMSTDIWQLPTAISDFIDWVESNAKNEKQKEISNAFKNLLNI